MTPLSPTSKIYLAGHTGLVGSATLRALQARGYKNMITRTQKELELTDQVAVRNFFQTEKPEYVILAAAKVGGIKANMDAPADFLYENIAIQNNVIWSAHEYGVKKLLFLGSACIYPQNAPQPIPESALMTGPLEPTNEGYALAKVAGMKLCEKIYQQFGKQFVSCMPCNIYGPGDNLNPTTSHVISSLVRRMHDAKKNGTPSMEVWGTGRARREFLYVEDLADAIVWLLENFSEKQFVNVGTGEEISIRDLAELIKKTVGFEGEIVFDTTKPDGSARRILDVSRLNALGWSAKTPLKIGIPQFYKWFLEQAGNVSV